MRWCEIGIRGKNRQSSVRFSVLNEELKLLGVDAEFETIEVDPSEIATALETAKADYAHIRLSDEAGALALPHLVRIPAAIATLRTADALVCEDHYWWPRCFLVEGINRSLSLDSGNIDLGGSVFILGANSQARAAVAAFTRVGFGRVMISDPDDDKSQAFVEELRRSYFGVQFQSVARNQVTQLPGVCSVAINTSVDAGEAPMSAELAYFNFLKPGGIWLDLSLFPLDQALRSEAISVGGVILDGYQVLAMTDAQWIRAAFSTDGKTAPELDVEAYALKLFEASV